MKINYQLDLEISSEEIDGLAKTVVDLFERFAQTIQSESEITILSEEDMAKIAE
jgi:hypothetical protein